MKCPKCSKINPEGSKFCNECGFNLSTVPANQPESDLSAPALEGERKQATVLFSDLSGYTAMTEKMDPEEVKNLMGDIFEKAGKIVEKYQGTVERFFGDEIMILFGVPRAHGDDPIRAIHTAIEIHELVTTLSPGFEERYNTNLSMHTGINSGLVITGDKYIGKGRHGLTGDTINLAKRLTGLANPGEIIIGENTFQKIEQHVNCNELATVKIKGKEESVRTFKIQGIKKSFQKDKKVSGRQVHSKMVGRDKDLNKLELAVANVINANGSIVNIIGEAGIGKSRLLTEFKHLEILKKVILLEGKSISIGSNLPFHPIIDLIKQWAQIKEDDTENIVLGKLESSIRDIDRQNADEIFPFVALLMGLTLSGKHLERVNGIDGEALERLILKGLRDLIIKISKDRPLIIVMEDLHWADASSISLLESIFSVSTSYPVLFINIFRPNFKVTDERIYNTLKSTYHDSCINIQLKALDHNYCQSLINNMLKIDGFPVQYRDKIINQTGGNPFFIEEVVRSLIDQRAIIVKDEKFKITAKIDDIHIPDTINDLLTARIDRLENKTKHLIKIASVVGRHFYHRIISRIATTIEDLDQRLTYLKEIQLIRERKHFNELEYIFKHALAQEAAYGSILFEKRKQIHLQVADAIEHIFTDRIHEFYGMLAMHYTRGENTSKAEHYLIKAGEETMRSSASDEALNYYQEGLKLYLSSNKNTIDREKAGRLEKNIAMAFYNKSRFADAIPHFDNVYKYWGLNTNPSTLKSIPIFLKNIFFIKTGMYRFFKGKQPSQRDEEILNLFYRFGSALMAVDLNRTRNIVIPMFNMAYKMNLSKSPNAVNLIMGIAAVIAMSKLNFNLSFKLLAMCSEKMDRTNIKNMIAYRSCHTMVCWLSGDLDKIEKLDTELILKASKKGELQQSTNYNAYTTAIASYKGDFAFAKAINSSLMELAVSYDYDLAKLTAHWQKAFWFIQKGDLNNSIKHSKKSIELARIQGRELYEFSSLSKLAEAYIIMENIKDAQKTIYKAESIKKRHKSISYAHMWSYYITKISLKNEILKKQITLNNKPAIEKLEKDALESSREIFNAIKNFELLHQPIFKLTGDLYWIIDRQKKALNCWGESIKLGKRFSTRPDLARTYFLVGKNLSSPQSRYKQLNGITAPEYLEKAKAMFEEMNLDWDLNELQKQTLEN